jgi:hypothetical protein
VSRVLARHGEPHLALLDPLMLRSAGSPKTAEIMRAATERHVGAHLAARLQGDATGERAELALALIAGVRLMRTVVGTTALREADPDALTKALTAMLDVVLDG